MRGSSAAIRKKAQTYEVSPDCRAPSHNTKKDAKGTGSIPRCTCPHAQELLAAHLAHRRAKYVLKYPEGGRQAGRPPKQRSVLLDRTHLVPFLPPELRDGACQDPVNMAILDRYTDHPHTQSTIEAARRVCRRCPVKTQCAEWAARAEKPAGAWAGMLAGMTPRERTRAALTRLAPTPRDHDGDDGGDAA